MVLKCKQGRSVTVEFKRKQGEECDCGIENVIKGRSLTVVLKM